MARDPVVPPLFTIKAFPVYFTICIASRICILLRDDKIGIRTLLCIVKGSKQYTIIEHPLVDYPSVRLASISVHDANVDVGLKAA
ncbi:hypothetical protein DENSPDRAFT_547780 [Dentipellis sp. KUC8613]|nr:hypothetical protein DENSPDRAFT_547780 [Dentipellis sp. KUC8613]